MTLIVGAHLSGRVALAADVRVTIKGTNKHYDNCLKIEPINDRICIACAGDLELARTLLETIAREVWSSREALRDRIEAMVVPVADRFWMEEDRHAEATCSLIVAEIINHPTSVSSELVRRNLATFKSKKKRDFESVMRPLLDQHSQGELEHTGPRQDVAVALFDQEPRPRLIFSRATAARTDPNAPLEFPAPSVALYAITLAPRMSPKPVDAGWGEALVRGAVGLEKLDKAETVAELEVGGNDAAGVQTLLTWIIDRKSQDEASIGGGVVTGFLDAETSPAKGFAFMCGDVWARRVALDSGEALGPQVLAHVERRETRVPNEKLFMRHGDSGTPLLPVRLWRSSDESVAQCWL